MNLTSFWQVFVSWRILAYPVFWLWCGPTTLSLREEHYPRYSHWEVHLGPNMLSLSELSVDWRHLCLEHSCLYPECCTQWQAMALFSSKDFFVESLVELPPRSFFLELGNFRNVYDSFTAVWLHSILASLWRLKASCKLLIEYSAEINAFSWGKLFYLELVSRKKKKLKTNLRSAFHLLMRAALGRGKQAIMTAVRTSSQRWFSPDVIAATLVLRTIKSHWNLSLLLCKLKQ